MTSALLHSHKSMVHKVNTLTNVKRDNLSCPVYFLTKYSRVDVNVKIASAQPVFSLKPNCASGINIKYITGWAQAQAVLIQQVIKLVPYNYQYY